MCRSCRNDTPPDARFCIGCGRLLAPATGATIALHDPDDRPGVVDVLHALLDDVATLEAQHRARGRRQPGETRRNHWLRRLTRQPTRPSAAVIRATALAALRQHQPWLHGTWLDLLEHHLRTMFRRDAERYPAYPAVLAAVCQFRREQHGEAASSCG